MANTKYYSEYILTGNTRGGLLIENTLYMNPSVGFLGIGTTAPSYKVDIFGTGHVQNGDWIINTSGSNDLRFSSFAGNNAVGYNCYVGEGGLVSRGAVGQTYKGSYNTSLGYRAFYQDTEGYNDVAIGMFTMYNNTTGRDNTACGYASLFSSVSAFQNTSIGGQSLYNLIDGYNNAAVGYYSLYHLHHSYFTTAIGCYSGTYVADGSANTDSYNCTYLGYDTRTKAAGSTNETVIGYSAIGNGDNTVTIGNTTNTGNYLFGKLNLSGSTINISQSKTPASSSAAGTQGDICWDSSYIYVCTAASTWKRTPISTW